MSKKKKRYPKNHIMELIGQPIYWWCPLCDKEYRLDKSEEQVKKFYLTLGHAQGESKVRRIIKNALGVK